MIVQIRDRDALESLTTANLRTYLEGHGWFDAGPWGERPIVIYSKEQDAQLWDILVPLRDAASDYAEFMAEAVATLAEAEDRSQLDVFCDLADSEASMASQASNGKDNKAANVWCVRAEYGKFTETFTSGGFVAIGWIPEIDLPAEAKNRKEIYLLYHQVYPQDAKKRVETNVGQIARFLLDTKPGDFVITPAEDSSQLWFGRVATKPYYDPDSEDIRHHGQLWPHRRKVEWAKRPLDKHNLSKEFSNTMQTGMTVFSIRHREEFLNAVVRMLWPYARIYRRSTA